jgi:septal ring factor EnvC (AmiA/AmiB activator)
VEAIAQRDIDSRWALADERELHASTEARASVVTKQVEKLAACACQVNQWEQEVEKLEGLLQELSTRETSLDRREADLKREQKALEDVYAQILARELDMDAHDTRLRDQEAQLAAQERQPVERKMQ